MDVVKQTIEQIDGSRGRGGCGRLRWSSPRHVYSINLEILSDSHMQCTSTLAGRVNSQAELILTQPNSVSSATMVS
jgi:hypothetical protein